MKLNNTVQNRYLFVYVKFSSGLQTVVLVNKPRQQTFKAAATLLREMASKSIVKFTTYYYANSWLTALQTTKEATSSHDCKEFSEVPVIAISKEAVTARVHCSNTISLL